MLQQIRHQLVLAILKYIDNVQGQNKQKSLYNLISNNGKNLVLQYVCNKFCITNKQQGIDKTTTQRKTLYTNMNDLIRYYLNPIQYLRIVNYLLPVYCKNSRMLWNFSTNQQPAESYRSSHLFETLEMSTHVEYFEV